MRVTLSAPAFAGQSEQRVIDNVESVTDDDRGLGRIAEDASVFLLTRGRGRAVLLLRARLSGWYVVDDRPFESWRRLQIAP